MYCMYTEIENVIMRPLIIAEARSRVRSLNCESGVEFVVLVDYNTIMSIVIIMIVEVVIFL